MNAIPARIQAMQDPVIPIVADWIRQNPGTISLGQGVVYYPPPPAAFERIQEFIQSPELNKYQPVIGNPALLSALEGKLRVENRIVLGEGNCVVATAGGNMAFQNAILAIADQDDEIILQTPFYFNHEMAVAMIGCRAVCVETDARYQLRLDAIADAITPRTRAIVTVSPNNPTGAVYPEADLRAVNALCRERKIYHIHDEAYEYFTYDGVPHVSPASFEDSVEHTISLFSLSKSYGFASWRIGYMVIPNALLLPIKKIQDTVLICPPVISQFAALGALEAGAAYCREKIAAIAETRLLVTEALTPLREWCVFPEVSGAFYHFMKVNASLSPMEIVRRLIEEHGVAVLPGTTFGMNRGCYLRVSYGALQRDTVVEGTGRLVAGLTSLLS